MLKTDAIDVDAVKAQTESVQKAFYAVSEKLYAQAQQAQGADPNAQQTQADDNAVDAEYTEVDDNN